MQNNDDRQISLDYVNGEIEAEAQDNKLPDGIERRVARKPFVIHDFDPPRDKEMAVFTHAKKLSEYIFVITEKSPKKLRWSIISRLHNTSIDIIENLYRANYERETVNRVEFQKRSMVSLNLLDFFAETAKRKQAINLHQMSVIARQISEVKRLLTGWIKSNKK